MEDTERVKGAEIPTPTRNHQIPSGVPVQTLQPAAMELGMEVVAGEHLPALVGAAAVSTTAEPSWSPSPLTPCFRSSRS